MAAVFDKAGIRFLYPENWTIVEENLVEWPLSVSLQVPGGGLWSVMVYEADTDTAELLRGSLDGMRKEYSGLESSVITEQFDDTFATGYEMYFYCLDFLICARTLAIKANRGNVLLLLWQAEDRDFDKNEAVFRAITVSLLREQVAA